ncbi:MAG: hypothetical protein D6801_10605, partial [Alphaproteobacteria bacterium]
MRTGFIISVAGHGLLLLWLVFGGLILPRREPPPVAVTEVSLVSAEEFAALSAPRTPAEAAPTAAPKA